MLKKNLRENDSDLKTNIDNIILDSFKEFSIKKLKSLIKKNNLL